jgi:hypothetical protein
MIGMFYFSRSRSLEAPSTCSWRIIDAAYVGKRLLSRAPRSGGRLTAPAGLAAPSKSRAKQALDDSAASMVGAGFAGDDDKKSLIIFGRRNKYFLIDIPNE